MAKKIILTQEQKAKLRRITKKARGRSVKVVKATSKQLLKAWRKMKKGK